MTVEHRPGCPADRIETFTASRPGAVLASPVAWPRNARGYRVGGAPAPGAVRLVRGPSTEVAVARCISCGGSTHDPELPPPIGPDLSAPPPMAGSGRLARRPLAAPRPQR